MTTIPTIMRAPKDAAHPYVRIATALACAAHLSLKAKGMMLYLLSRPDTWSFHVADILRHVSEGETAIYAVLKELEQAGYLERFPERDGKGRVRRWVYRVYEMPQTGEPLENSESPAALPSSPFPENPNVERVANNPHGGNPNVAHPSLITNDLSNIKKKITTTTARENDVFSQTLTLSAPDVVPAAEVCGAGSAAPASSPVPIGFTAAQPDKKLGEESLAFAQPTQLLANAVSAQKDPQKIVPAPTAFEGRGLVREEALESVPAVARHCGNAAQRSAVSAAAPMSSPDAVVTDLQQLVA
ncbi:MAG: hypothetical protein OWS74_04250, partial [Firmicutes bacterium]|nr:hypothetical protein [Bacillota bacterium]